jgi:hypothetical protein
MKTTDSMNVKTALAAIFPVIFTAIMIAGSEHYGHAKKPFPTFIGIATCKKCHEAEGIGNQHRIWASSPHAKAYQTLSTDRAAAIALKASVERPSENQRCLKCHTTGGGRIPATRTEGVGCEACHGPGSLYNDFENHASFISRENAYRKAQTLGMYPVLGLNGIKSREYMCRSCHRDDRPCVPDNPAERKRKQLPLSLIADFVFRHPVTRRSPF